jgi:tankyrase
VKNKRLAKLVRNRPEKYPYELERHYERVLDRIMDVWGSATAEQYFLDLLVDKRGDREGFPLKVAEEIFFLSELHVLMHPTKGKARIEDETQRLVKADRRTQEFRATLEQRGLKFVPTDLFRCVSGGNLSSVVLFVNAGMGAIVKSGVWRVLMA